MISGLVFQGAWRDYQARLLDELDGHLADKRLNVVAAPGSGKTVLGLEVMRRIGRPALILAPTITIRNQWVDRLRDLFLAPDAPAPDWISTSLAAPKALTVSTYQALHAASDEAADDEPADEAPAGPGTIARLAAFYNGLGSATLILDEAHHLRKEWWKTLAALDAALGGPSIVALTATPPYDVERGEWRNYESLCGPADAEISIPELVRNGDLCPHQDYIHVSLPTAAEDSLITAHREAILGFIAALREDAAFRDIVAAHPWMQSPVDFETDILEQPEMLSAMLVFTRFVGRPVPAAALGLLGLAGADVPEMSLGWLELLLTGLIFGTAGDRAGAPPRLKELRKELARLGAVEGRRVRLFEGEDFYPTLAGSLAKLDSVAAIVRAEAASLGPRLRLVVLADFVRESDLPAHAGDPFRPAKLGAAPIFEALRRAAIADVRPAVLTGTLLILPAAAMPALIRAATAARLEPDGLRAHPLGHDPGFVRVETGGRAAERIVGVVTALFDSGEVNLLVGTQALLGEGWDAPAINALVLASYVGSYMLSNQMRGRAIRTDPGDPEKTANIWHLATIVADAGEDRWLTRLGGIAAPADPFDPIGRDLGPDMALLKRRFDAFEGIWNRDDARIENGIARLELGGRDWDGAGVQALNEAMLERAADRGALARRWRTALAGGGPWPAMRQLARVNYAPRQIAFADTLRYLIITGILGGLGAAANTMGDPWLPTEIGALIWAFVGLSALYALPKLSMALYLLVRNGTLEGSLGQVGAAILDTMDEANLLANRRDDLTVVTGRGTFGEALVRLEGGLRAEERLFLDALDEVLGPIRNPRYLIVRRSRLGLRLRTDYHAVPAIFGRAKPLAQHFTKRWNRRVGAGRLVYLRSAAGRRLLLRARARSFAAGFQRLVGRFSQWQ